MNRLIENARRYICCIPCSNNTTPIMVVDTSVTPALAPQRNYLPDLLPHPAPYYSTLYSRPPTNPEIGYITRYRLQFLLRYFSPIGVYCGIFLMMDLCANSFSILCVADGFSDLALNRVLLLCAALLYLSRFHTSTKSSGAVISDTRTTFLLLQSRTTSQNSSLSNSSYFFTSRLYLMGYLE